MTSKGFTKIDNSILDDENISFDAKGIYAILKRYISIPNFKINKIHIKSVTGLGEIRFNRAWKELKEKGILVQVKKSVNGRFEYTYTLKDTENIKSIKPKNKKSEKPVDSNGDVPIEGQIYIGDIIIPVEQQKPADEVTTKNITTISDKTGLTSSQATELLEVANNDTAKVLQSYKYTISQSNVKNIFNYMKWAIKNNKVNNAEIKHKVNDSFSEYKQRNYDFNELEQQLVFGVKSKSLYL